MKNRILKYALITALSIQLLFAYYSHNPYVKYISKDNHKILKLNYAYLDYYDCNEKKPDMVIEELYNWMLEKKHYSRKGLYFKPDYNLPRKCRSYPNNYTGMHLDRGHNAANYDWAWNRKYQKQTFLMSNISPQTPSLNRYLWKTIEGFARYQSKINEHVFVYTGSFGKKGYIKNKVVIPKYWYKLILVPKTKEAYLFITKNTVYPRKQYGYSDIQKYLVTFEEFKKLNHDFALKISGDWKFQTEIVKKKTSIINKLKEKFKDIFGFK